MRITRFGHAADARGGPLSRKLLAEHEIVAAGSTTTQAVRIATDVDAWPLYLEVSRRSGLDFRPHVGRTAELRTTPVQAPIPGESGHVLVLGGRVVGAWLSGEGMSGVLSLAEQP